MLIRSTIPSFVQGETQQPSELRNPLKADRQVNAVPDVARGLCLRAGTRHVANVFPSPSATPQDVPPFTHKMITDGSEHILTIWSGGNIKVHDLDGNEKSVTVVDAAAGSYIDSDSPKRDLCALTLGDSTIIVNRKAVIAMSPLVAPQPSQRAVVWVKRGNYSTAYNIKVRQTHSTAGLQLSTPVVYDTSYTTPNGTVGTDIEQLRTNAIAANLVGRFLGGLAGLPFTVEYETNSSIFTISATSLARFEIEVFDSEGGSALGAAKDVVTSFSDLPPTAPAGFVVKVLGSLEEGADDYWVTFDALRTSAQAGVNAARRGSWIETVAPGTEYRINPETMPVVLKRNPATGNFTLEYPPWADRLVGDDEFVRRPSFVGKTISGVALFRNRLCFLSGGNVVMSGSSDLYNYWRTTGLQVLDSDPIDISVPTAEATDFAWLVPVADSALLVSERAQMLLSVDGPLTASSVGASLAGNFDVDTSVKPVVLGQQIFLAFTAPSGAGGVRTFSIEGDARVRVSDVITAEIPDLVEGGVLEMDGDSSRGALIVVSKPGRAFLYRWFDVGRGQRVQNAWGRLEFREFIVSVQGTAVVDGQAYLVMQRVPFLVVEQEAAEYFHTLERLPLDPTYSLDLVPSGTPCPPVHLDRLVSAGPFSSVPGQQLASLPYGISDQLTLWFVSEAGEYRRVPFFVDSTNAVLFERVTASGRYYFGYPIDFDYISGPAVVMSQTQTGGSAPQQGGRIQVVNYSVKASLSGPFVVSAYRPGIGSISQRVGVPNNFGTLPESSSRSDISTKVYTFTRAENIRLRIQSDTAMPVVIQAGGWEGYFTADYRSIG